MKKKLNISLTAIISNSVISLLIGIFISLYLLQTPMVVIDSSFFVAEQDQHKIKLKIENKGSAIAKNVIIRTVVGQVSNDEMEILHEGINASLVQLNAGEHTNFSTEKLTLKEQESLIYISISSHDNNIFREFLRRLTGNPYERSKWLVHRPKIDKRQLYYFGRFRNARYKKVMMDAMDKLRNMTPAVSKDVDEMAI